MIKNIVFDLGRVLLDFRPFEYLRNTLGENELSDKLYKHIFQSDEWLLLDRGAIEVQEAIDRISERIPEERNYVEFYMHNWYEILVPITDTIEILKKLKAQGYKLYILSNFHKAAFDKVFNKYDWFNNFDGGLVSYEVHLLKPEAEIYHRLIEKCGIIPGESLFIDDMKPNVESAAKEGFNAIQFKNPEQLQSDLEKKLILIRQKSQFQLS